MPEVSSQGREEWIAERIALIIEGNGGESHCFYSVAESLARRCWESIHGDPQKSLFD